MHYSLLLLLVAADDFTISTRKKEDTVEVQADKGKTTFVVKSPTGIGQAVIERKEEAWPKAVTLRLHLKGLESFQVSNGKVTLNVAVSAGKVRRWKDGKEDAELDKNSPFWTDIIAKDGYFEMTLPKPFLEGNPKSITLKWIDFYR